MIIIIILLYFIYLFLFNPSFYVLYKISFQTFRLYFDFCLLIFLLT